MTPCAAALGAGRRSPTHRARRSTGCGEDKATTRRTGHRARLDRRTCRPVASAQPEPARSPPSWPDARRSVPGSTARLAPSDGNLALLAVLRRGRAGDDPQRCRRQTRPTEMRTVLGLRGAASTSTRSTAGIDALTQARRRPRRHLWTRPDDDPAEIAARQRPTRCSGTEDGDLERGVPRRTRRVAMARACSQVDYAADRRGCARARSTPGPRADPRPHRRRSCLQGVID